MAAPLRITPVHSAADRERFITFPWQVYRGAARDELWVPPLLHERREYLDPERGPFYRHADVQLFLAWRGDRLAGTVSAHINHLHDQTHGERMGFFGFFEALDDPEAAAALLAAAAEWVRLRGAQALRGPMNFSINDECGLLVEGFDAPPVAMMTYNPRRYVEYIERFGLRKLADLYAWLLEDADPPPAAGARLARVAALARRRSAMTIRRLRMRDFDAEVARGWQLYNRAWAANWGAVPMTGEEFRYLARSFKPFLDPDLLVLAEVGGELAGLLIAVPDLNIPLRRMDGTLLPTGWARFLWHRRKIDTLRVLIMGVLPEYRRRGIDAVLYQEALTAARRNGYRRAELSWIVESNAVMNNTLAALGARRYKTYRIYELPLAAAP